MVDIGVNKARQTLWLFFFHEIFAVVRVLMVGNSSWVFMAVRCDPDYIITVHLRKYYCIA